MESVGNWLWAMTALVIWVQVYGCLEQERAGLLQLKQHLGDQLPLEAQSLWLAYLASWKDGKTNNCCDDWKGVMCGPNHRVVSLSLDYYLIDYIRYSSGVHFNASILIPFAELRELNLTRFIIKTWTENEGAPKLSSTLKSLELLNLEDNSFNVNGLSQFHGYSSLKYLFLGSNNLKGIALHDIEAISQNLEELGLAQNQITGFINHNGSSKLSASIKALDLSNNELDNNIISQLSGFQSLHTLDLGNNGLRGIVPINGSTKLSSSLKVLDLSNNKLGNNIISQLSGLPSLHTLYLSYCQITGIVSINALHQLRNLEVLDLSYNQITRFANYNASLYGGLTSLQELHLSYNQLVGEIPKWLRNLTSLETLDLSFNQLVGNIGSSSPLAQLLFLTNLRVRNNHLEIPDSFQSFANHTRLKYFVGDSNKVVHDDVQPSLPLRLQLQALSLSDCSLFAYLPFLPYQRDLMYADLSDNSIKEEFPTWLFKNNLRLDTIFLNNNSFTGSLHLPSLPNAYVSRIEVGQNKIQGHIPANINVIFPKLVVLNLSNNEFKGNVPLGIGDLNYLKALYLSNNHLLGKINHLPKSLRYLDLSNNEFNGELPPTQGLLSLEVLNLQGNKYSSGLQVNKFGPRLQFLNLSYNSLEGPIPKHILTNSSRLWVLDLSFNRFMGPLPFFSSQISILYLNNNRLSGHVPYAFYTTVTMQILDLSNNELEGHIPNTIGSITTLNVLLLRGNQFEGQIPYQLCNLAELSILDLSYNNLHGSIPSCLGHIITLQYDGVSGGDELGETGEDKWDSLNPYRNMYHPTFYNKVEFRTKNMAYSYHGDILNFMSGIDLSCNKLTGHIPHELGNLSNIHALNLSHNQLWGLIPSTFSNLSNIESLDLSYNLLYGRIPAEVTNLDTLQVFNVSYNNLSGRIPFEAHSTTFDATSYEANPFLCGPPLSINCTTGETPSTNRSESRDNEDGDAWIDMETFYVTFAVSGVTMFLAVVIIMLINPHWWNASFYLFKTCIFSSYYFFEDSIRKLRRARRV